MAKLSSINKNNKRIKLSNRFYAKRKKLKDIIMDKKLPLEERFKAQQKLSSLPRNSSKIRIVSLSMTCFEKFKGINISKVKRNNITLSAIRKNIFKVTD